MNGFDGALTMLGIVVGFRIEADPDPRVIAGVCMGAAIALAVSGVSSAYISESAERHRALRELERAMISDLKRTTHGAASRVVPLTVAVANGAAPLLSGLLITLPIWLEAWRVELPWDPLQAAIGVAFAIVFVLGVFVGRISGRSWLYTGLRAVLVAAIAAALIVGVTL